MKGKIRRIISILLMVCFIASVTAASASACSCYLASNMFKNDPTLQSICQHNYPYSLHDGSQGPAVKLVQEALINLGYYLGPSGADGYFGYYTKKAVIHFQNDYGLDPDAKVGPCTLDTLDSAIADRCPRCLPY